MYDRSAQEIHDLFVQGELSACSILDYFLSRIEERDEETKAFLTVYGERAREKAKLLDIKKNEGKPLGKMAGVPIAIKDNIHVKGELTTCASKFLENYRAVFDSTATRLLEEEDALILGKTNLDEFAMGSFTENSAFFPSKNPWDLACYPGGSSGGSAAAVAARFCPLSLGSDTGGSIRQPAALTGTVGFKPSYGRVSRYGLVAFASSFDQIGPFATSTKDVAYIMETLSGPCTKDATHVNTPAEPYLTIIEKPIEGMTVGVPWHFLESLTPQIRDNFEKSIETLKSLGVKIFEVDLDILQHSVATYYILATAEASTNLARYDGIRYGLRSSEAETLEEVYELSKKAGFGPEVKSRILLGTYVLSSGIKDSYYKKAQQVRTLVIQKFKQAFSSCDVIAMPGSATPAMPIGSLQDPLQIYLQDLYTISANLAGLPGISVPSGFTLDGKPLGLQLLGPYMEDAKVLQMAHHFEQATLYSQKIPPLFQSKA